jgi:glycosyltransferase involved in cell wall biosynthesis
MRQHILLYSDNPPIGGVHQYNHSLLCKLATSGFRVSSVQIVQENQLIELQKELGVEPFWLETNLTTGYARSFTDLGTPKTLLSTIRPDLIVFSDGWPLGNFAAKQVAIEMGIPYIVVVGFVDPNCAVVQRDDGISYTEAVRYQYTLAEAFVAVSQENLDLLHNLFNLPEKMGQVIHYGRPASFFAPPNLETRQRLRQAMKIPENAVVCFTSARLAPVKGYDVQLEAIAQLKDLPVWKDLHFVWAGSAPKGENIQFQLEQRIHELGVADRIHFLGERQDIPDLLEASDIYILSSRAEGMPLAIMEAMAKGLPVIASAVSGIPEELDNTGKLLPNPNTDLEAAINELASTIQAWTMDSTLRQSVGQACKQRAERLFKEERMLEQYMLLINRVLRSQEPLEVAKSTRMKTLAPETIQVLQNQIHHACFVWDAWYKHTQGDLAGMYQALKAGSQLSPLLPMEKIVNWVELFSKFSREERHKLNIYALCQTTEWQRLILSSL